MKSHTILTKSSRGFSIVEVAVAMGVVTLMLTTFLGIFGPAQKTVQRSLSTKDASAMKDALNNEFSILREQEKIDLEVTTAFGKAVNFITESHNLDTTVLVYRYKAEPVDPDNDGILPAYTEIGGIPGQDYVVQTAVRKFRIGEDLNPLVASELAVESVDGPVFVVRMTQLLNNTGSDLILSTQLDQLLDPDDHNIVSVATYDDAVIAFRADFYQLPSNALGFVNSNSWNFDTIGSPVVSANIASRR